MSNGSNGLRFDVYERVHLPDEVAAIDELEEIELVPRIQIVQLGEQVLLRGHLLLTGIYRAKEAPSEEQPLEHWIPVEITLPMNRVHRLDDISVEIDNFDVELLSSRTLNITGVLSLLGIELDKRHEPENWQREEPFTVVHSREAEAKTDRLEGAPSGNMEFQAEPSDQIPEQDRLRQAAEVHQHELIDHEAEAREIARRYEAETQELLLREAARREEETRAAIRREEEARAAVQREEEQRVAIRREEEAQAAIPCEEEARAAVQREEEARAAIRSEEEAQAAIRREEEAQAVIRREEEARAAIRSEEEERAAIRREEEARAVIRREEEARAAEARNEFEREVARQEAEQRKAFYSSDNALEPTQMHEFQKAAGPAVTERDDERAGAAATADDQGLQSGRNDAGESFPAAPYQAAPAAFSDPAVSEPDTGKKEMRVALMGKSAAAEPDPSSPGLGFRSLLQSSKREQEARAVAEQSAQRAAEEANKSAGDDIEWKNIFFGQSIDESFRRLRMCIVQREETLDQIAGRYQLQPREIALYNRLSDVNITEGQVLYIP